MGMLRAKMSSRRTTKPPRNTRRGIAIATEAITEDKIEPYFSSRPTRRQVDLPPPGTTPPTNQRVRGEYSIAAARGIPVDIVSGEIDGGRRKRRTTTAPAAAPAVEDVHLAALTKRELTVIVKGQPITLERHDALALASIILTSFG